MKNLVQGDSLKYFKSNVLENVNLVLTSPSYFTDTSKKDLLEGEIGYGSPKEEYVRLITSVITDINNYLIHNGSIIMVIGRYNDISIQSIIYMIEDKLLPLDIHLSGYQLHGKGNHESIVVFTKGNKIKIDIPDFYKYQIYDKVGFFGRINNEILDWAITNFTNEGDFVVDPFAGAGSTVKRATLLNRKSLGVEINPKFI